MQMKTVEFEPWNHVTGGKQWRSKNGKFCIKYSGVSNLYHVYRLDRRLQMWATMEIRKRWSVKPAAFGKLDDAISFVEERVTLGKA